MHSDQDTWIFILTNFQNQLQILITDVNADLEKKTAKQSFLFSHFGHHGAI